MKQSFLRMILGVLVLSLGLAAALGFVARAYENRLPTEQSILFSGTEEISLYSRDGILLQTLSPGPGGKAASLPVPLGNYYAFSGDGCTEFSLGQGQVPEILGGSGWTEGRRLHVCRETNGTLWVQLRPREPGVHSFCLTAGSYFRRELFRCDSSRQAVGFLFSDLPFGTYILYLDNEPVSRITLSPDAPIFSFTFV